MLIDCHVHIGKSEKFRLYYFINEFIEKMEEFGIEKAVVGINVSTTPNVTIGRNTLIGIGSVVTHDIPANVIAFGNPCKVHKRIDQVRYRSHPEKAPYNSLT